MTDTIDEAAGQCDERTSEREKVAMHIKEAFRYVSLDADRGVGLWEGRAIDDGIGIAAARMRDERSDWASIPIRDLCACESSLTFADPDGVRFLLPAFMLAQLEGQLPAGIVFILTDCFNPHEHFSALSPRQRQAVREFLLFLKDDPGYESDKPSIERALTAYWAPSGTDRESRNQE